MSKWTAGFLAVVFFGAGWLMGFGPRDFYDYLRDSRQSATIRESSNSVYFEPDSENLAHLKKYAAEFPDSLQTPRVMLAINKHYLKKGELAKSSALLKSVERNLQGSIRYHFFALKWAKQLAKHGYPRKSRKLLDSLDSSWIQPEKLRDLGKLALQQGQDKAAANYWRKLCLRYPDTDASEEILGRMAELEYDLGTPVKKHLKIAGAIYLCEKAQYQKALEILGNDQDDTLAYYRIKVLNRAGSFEKAIEYAALFCAKTPHSEWLEPVMLNMAYNLGVKSRHYQKAILCYRDLLKKFPKTSRRAGIELSIGDCLVGKGELTQAREQYLRVIDYTDNPNLLQSAFYSIANTYLRRGQTQEALPWLEKASLQRGQLDDEVLWRLVNACLELGKCTKARKTCSELLARTRSTRMRRQVEQCLKEID